MGQYYITARFPFLSPPAVNWKTRAFLSAGINVLSFHRMTVLHPAIIPGISAIRSPARFFRHWGVDTDSRISYSDCM
jgi:hypothetical protein